MHLALEEPWGAVVTTLRDTVKTRAVLGLELPGRGCGHSVTRAHQ